MSGRGRSPSAMAMLTLLLAAAFPVRAATVFAPAAPLQGALPAPLPLALPRIEAALQSGSRGLSLGGLPLPSLPAVSLEGPAGLAPVVGVKAAPAFVVPPALKKQYDYLRTQPDQRDRVAAFDRL